MVEADWGEPQEVREVPQGLVGRPLTPRCSSALALPPPQLHFSPREGGGPRGGGQVGREEPLSTHSCLHLALLSQTPPAPQPLPRAPGPHG